MPRIFLAAAGFYLATLCLLMQAAAQTSAQAPSPGMAGAARLPPGEGPEATIRVCGKCHDAGIFESQTLDAEGWKPVVEEMAKMSDGSSDDFAAITAYLTKAFPGR